MLRPAGDHRPAVDLWRIGERSNVWNDPASWLENRPYGMGTPLHKAVELGLDEVVRLLLSRGADRALQDSVGRTAHALAVASGNDDMARLVEPCSLKYTRIHHTGLLEYLHCEPFHSAAL